MLHAILFPNESYTNRQSSILEPFEEQGVNVIPLSHHGVYW